MRNLNGSKSFRGSRGRIIGIIPEYLLSCVLDEATLAAKLKWRDCQIEHLWLEKSGGNAESRREGQAAPDRQGWGSD